MDISVVIPVYGCRGALPELHKRLSGALAGLTTEYEIILVNDACPQDSWVEIEKICAADDRVMGIDLSRNFGQINAITAGLEFCTGKRVVVMDCDLQDPPEKIADLWNKANEGYDIVYVKSVKRKETFFRLLLSKSFYKVLGSLSDNYYNPDLRNFSICDKKAIDAYLSMREQKRAYIIFLKWLGFRTATIEIEQNERAEGKSSYSLKKRLNLAFNIISAQSNKLLKQFIGLGFVMAAASLFIAIIEFILFFVDRASVAGWTSMIVAIFFVGGLILINLGVVGVYIGNIFDEGKKRPLYVVREILNPHEKEKQE